MGSSRAATTLLLVGRMGNGKSATGNSILGRKELISLSRSSSVTARCTMHQTTMDDGRVVNVVDTPGLFDPSVPQDALGKEIVKCIELAKDGVHGVLFVLSVRGRFTREEAATLDSLKVLFGEKIVNYMVVVFTGGDELEDNEQTLQSYLDGCSEELKMLLDRCNRRMILFDNKTKSKSKKKEQITELLKLIDIILAENGGRPYTDETFRLAQEKARLDKLSKELDQTKKENAERCKQLTETHEKLTKELIEKVEMKFQLSLTKLEAQLASERTARIQSEIKIQELRNQLEREKNKGSKNEGSENKGSTCSIL